MAWPGVIRRCDECNIMGHRKSIVRQAIDTLDGFAAYGQSKHADKAANGGRPAKDKIYSYGTMRNYKDVAVHFADWARKTHHCRDIQNARKYTGEYLQSRMDVGLSAYTVRRDAAALGKLYQCATTDLGVALPGRHRADVHQHRDPNTWRGHFSESKNADFVGFCRGTGLRRCELTRITPSQVIRGADGSVAIVDVKGKGGKVRDVPVRAEYASLVVSMASDASAAGKRQIFTHISKWAPVHAYRAEYARACYADIARPVASIPPNERYTCQRDMVGTVYDRIAMQTVSQYLGHNRVDVMALSYLR